jgi:hypothetical protein
VLTCRVVGLDDGTAYTFRVTATNVVGTSAPSAASSPVTPRLDTVPDPPLAPAASAASEDATVSWTAPVDDGGSAINGYMVTATPGGATCPASGAATTCTVTGLANATAYTYTVRAMTAYFADFAQSFLRPAGLVCRLNVASDIPDAPVSAERRHGLYLAFKEALHNVLQHAAATEVLLEIRIDGRALVIVLADNGRGFEAGPVAAGSDGLLNMRTRLNQMGGSCVVESDLGCGTRVTFNFPLKG